MALSSAPFRVEVAPGSDPADDTTWTWIDVTGYVRNTPPIRVTQGRRDEASKIQPSSCAFTLNNSDGRFIPDNPLSTYYQTLRRNTPVRVSAWDGTTWQTRFTGFISELKPRRDQSGNDRTVQVRADGMLRRLRQRDKQIRSPIREILEDNVADLGLHGYWPMEDGRHTVRLTQIVGRGVAYVTDDVVFQGDDSLQGSQPVTAIEDGDSFGASFRPERFTGDWDMSFLMRYEPPDATSGAFPIAVAVVSGASSSVRFLQFGAERSDDEWFLRALDDEGTIVDEGRLSVVIDGVDYFDSPDWLHISIVSSDTNDVVWLTAMPLGEFTLAHFTGVTLTDPGTFDFGNIFISVPSAGQAVSIGHITVGDDGFEAAAAIVEQGAVDGFAGERAGSRFARIATGQGIPWGGQGSSSDTARMGPQPVDSFLAAFDRAQELDQSLITDRPGQLHYRTRRSLVNQSPALELTVGQHLASPPEPTLDDQRIVNDVIAQREGGSEERRHDQDSIDEEGHYEEAVTLNAYLDSDLGQLAAHRLAHGTNRDLRWPSIPLKLHDNTELIEAWTQTELGDRVTVEHSMPELPGVEIDLLIEGWTEEMSLTRWDVTLTCSPGRLWQVGTLDDDPNSPDTDIARLDVHAQLDSGIDDTTTSVDVEITAGPAITTDSSYLPVDVEVGGEQMTVTAVGALAGSVQTLTVTRSVNGVVKAHSAGDAVHAARPLRLAL